MAISFNAIPNNLLTPFCAVELDNSAANQGPSLLAYRALLLGQKLAAGTASDNTLHRVTNADQVLTLAGRGSQLHNMAQAWFAANKSTEVYVGCVPDNGAGVQATGKIVFAGTATAAGTVSFYAGGRLVEVAVATGDDAADVATAFAAEITADLDLAITAAVDGSVDEEVDFTYRHKGLGGNEYDLRLNYQDGEALPAGITATITAMAGGTTNPTLTTMLAALGDSWFNVVVHPWTDATSLTAIEADLLDRTGPLRQIDGLAVTAKSDSHANLGTLGDSRNSQHSVIFGTNSSPTPPCEYAANAGAVIAYYGAIDPARPFQTLALSWVKAPAEASRWTLEERNLLLHDGIATTKVGPGSVVQIERPVTTYKQNAAGADDPSYRDATSILTLMYLRYSFRNAFMLKFPRHKLASDGARFGAGQAVITPKIAKAFCVGWFEQMEDLGLVEDVDSFKTNLVVERNASDVNRLDILLPPDLMNSLVVTATNLQFRL